MKSNQIMTRSEFIKIQRTKDSYFNANELLIKFQQTSPDINKSMIGYKQRQDVKEYIHHLQAKEDIEKPLIAGRGRNATTWMHPLLMIDFAMYLSLDFKTMVLKWALDGLIKTRHAAGDYYNEMCATILEVYVDCYNKKPPPLIYIQEASFIKSLVTDKSRNEMTEQELRQLTYLQKFNANLIQKQIGKASRVKRLKEAAEIQI